MGRSNKSVAGPEPASVRLPPKPAASVASAFDPLRTLVSHATSTRMRLRESAIRAFICFAVAMAFAVAVSAGVYRFLDFSYPVSEAVFTVTLVVSYNLAELLAFRRR